MNSEQAMRSPVEVCLYWLGARIVLLVILIHSRRLGSRQAVDQKPGDCNIKKSEDCDHLIFAQEAFLSEF